MRAPEATMLLTTRIKAADPYDPDWSDLVRSLYAINPEASILENIRESLPEIVWGLKQSYYGEEGTSPVSDIVFDRLEQCLREIDPTNPILQKVGGNS